MDVKEIRDLAQRFTPGEIEGCISDQLATGENVCLRNASTEQVINELSKAQFVRNLVEQGMQLSDAVRELAKRIRRVQAGFEEEKR